MDLDLRNYLENSINNNNYQYSINEIKKYFSNNSNIKITYKKINQKSELIILVKFKRKTKYNPYRIDIIFYIEIDKHFPETQPYVKCLTNFTNPTLFDCRNLLSSIIFHVWSSSSTLVEIINKIPDFLTIVAENNNNKILVYYGDYQLQKIFSINDFMANFKIKLFRVQQVYYDKLTTTHSNKDRILKDRYLVLTDIYFLIFEPIPDNKSFAKLLFSGNIRKLNSSDNSLISQNTLSFEWKSDNEQSKVEFIFVFEKGHIYNFLDLAGEKIAFLEDKFKMYQDDLNKPINSIDPELIKNIDIEKLIELAIYKEELLVKNKTINLVRELMTLYQKIIEVYSAKGSSEFEKYLIKLRNLLASKEIEKTLVRENKKKNIANESPYFNIEIGKLESIKNIEHEKEKIPERDKYETVLVYSERELSERRDRFDLDEIDVSFTAEKSDRSEKSINNDKNV